MLPIAILAFASGARANDPPILDTGPKDFVQQGKDPELLRDQRQTLTPPLPPEVRSCGVENIEIRFTPFQGRYVRRTAIGIKDTTLPSAVELRTDFDVVVKSPDQPAGGKFASDLSVSITFGTSTVTGYVSGTGADKSTKEVSFSSGRVQSIQTVIKCDGTRYVRDLGKRIEHDDFFVLVKDLAAILGSAIPDDPNAIGGTHRGHAIVVVSTPYEVVAGGKVIKSGVYRRSFEGAVTKTNAYNAQSEPAGYNFAIGVLNANPTAPAAPKTTTTPKPEEKAKPPQVSALPPDGTAPAAAASIAASATGFYATANVAATKVSRPATRFGRLEIGGLLVAYPAMKFDNDDTEISAGGTVGYRFDADFLGATRRFDISLSGWRLGGSASGSFGTFDPGPGGTTGIFSPGTGYAVGGLLTDGKYKSEYLEYAGEVRVGVTLPVGDGIFVMPRIGFSLGHQDIDEHFGFGIGAPPFTTFEQRVGINNTYYGPTFGIGARAGLGAGFYVMANADLGLRISNADLRWSTFVPLVDAAPRTDSFSDSRLSLVIGGMLGIGYAFNGISIEATAAAQHHTASPYLRFSESDSLVDGSGGAGIGWGSQTTLSAGVRARFAF